MDVRAFAVIGLLAAASCDQASRLPASRYVMCELADARGLHPGSGPVGDVDGDGFGDVIVGQRIFSGRSGALLHTVDVWFSAVSSTAGDVDGDGVPDFALGQQTEGVAWVFSGSTGEVLRTFRGEAADAFGASVAVVPDLDGDDLADVVVGAPLALGGGFARAFSGRDGSVSWSVHGGSESLFGSKICVPGDVDLDGITDVWIAASRSGYVAALSGRSGDLLYRTERLFPDAVIAATDDRDGDGVRELWACARGSTAVYSGASGELREVVHHDCKGSWLVGDVDGDGREEIACSRRVPLGSFIFEENAEGVRIQSGSDARVIAEVAYGPFSWSSPRPAGDVDRDGIADFLVPGREEQVLLLSGAAILRR